jgi:hypothetical protein
LDNGVWWRRCIYEHVDDNHDYVDLGDDVSTMAEQKVCRWCVSLGGVARRDNYIDDVNVMLSEK